VVTGVPWPVSVSSPLAKKVCGPAEPGSIVQLSISNEVCPAPAPPPPMVWKQNANSASPQVWVPSAERSNSAQPQKPPRADRIANAPSWRGPFAKRRAVIPATGYYEWLPTEDADGKPFKQPYYIHPADETLSFAGLYELWPDPAKDPDDPDPIDAWLDPNLTDKNEAQRLISGIE
jgi:SOS response associated peptidase (SRAP)